MDANTTNTVGSRVRVLNPTPGTLSAVCVVRSEPYDLEGVELQDFVLRGRELSVPTAQVVR